MPQKNQHKNPLPPNLTEAQRGLYKRYLSDFLQIADRVDAEAEYPEFQILSGFESVTPYITYIEIIADVVVEAYGKQLKKLAIQDILSIIGMLDECAQQKADNEPFVLDAEILLTIPHQHFLSSDLVEEIINQLGEDSIFKKRVFLLYLALAIMQLSMVIGANDMPEDEAIRNFIDIRICLERAKFSLGIFSQKQKPAHKEIASKGGRKRFHLLYGAAKEFSCKRYEELLTKKPAISKRQAALTIADEAEAHPAFRIMSKDNLFETIYRWLREI